VNHECNQFLKCKYGFNFFIIHFLFVDFLMFFLVMCFVTYECVLKLSIICCANVMASTWCGKCKVHNVLPLFFKCNWNLGDAFYLVISLKFQPIPFSKVNLNRSKVDSKS
jgi:hypothetical protein